MEIEDDLISLKLPDATQEESIIKVIGVGGGGSNAVNHMFRQGNSGVEFVVCNTDIQALRQSRVKNRIQLGKELTEGRGLVASPKEDVCPLSRVWILSKRFSNIIPGWCLLLPEWGEGRVPEPLRNCPAGEGIGYSDHRYRDRAFQLRRQTQDRTGDDRYR